MTLRGRVQVVLAAAVGPLATLLVLDSYHDGHRLALIGLLTALALGAGWLAGRRLIERPIQHLLAVAQRRAAGDLKARFRADPPTSEFARLGLALNDTAAAFERLLDQKTLLAGEVQHRVMNSLHLLGAILHLHARQVDSETARQHLNEARERVASMSIVHRHLHEGASPQSVDFGMVLRDICQETADADLGEGQGTVETAADAVELPTDTAMNLALIAHELIASAGKHAHRGTGGRLRVELRRDGGSSSWR
jgi:two-component sensor histidine kinase